MEMLMNDFIDARLIKIHLKNHKKAVECHGINLSLDKSLIGF